MIKMKTYIQLCMILVVLLAIAFYFGYAKYNTIIMNDSTEAVADSILKLNSLLDRLPYSSGTFRNYGFADSSDWVRKDLSDNTTLFINDVKIDENAIDSIKLLAGYSHNEKTEFLILTNFLRKNNLWGAGRGGSGLDTWWYDYHGTSEKSFSQARLIIAISKSGDMEDLMHNPFNKVIDQKGRLVLLALRNIKLKLK